MSINTLSLIVHTTLLNSLMPPNVFYVFKRYLNLQRLNISYFNKVIEDKSEVDISDYLKSSDYDHLFARNLILIITALLIFIWAFCRIMRKEKEPIICNIALRIFYEIFLEVCICSVINLTQKSGFQWVLSFISSIGILVFIGFLISLFFYNGPYIKGFYSKIKELK